MKDISKRKHLEALELRYEELTAKTVAIMVQNEFTVEVDEARKLKDIKSAQIKELIEVLSQYLSLKEVQ